MFVAVASGGGVMWHVVLGATLECVSIKTAREKNEVSGERSLTTKYSNLH
jgi:hypothetical protein